MMIRHQKRSSRQRYPKKVPRLGQHFLTSQSALIDMVETSNAAGQNGVGNDVVVLEIGPGKGVLTEKLLEQVHTGSSSQVIAIETDATLIPHLQERFAADIANNHLVLIHDDILKIVLEKVLPSGRQYKIIANIPYYITGEIMRLFLSHERKPQSMTVLVQKEVAERIVAAEGKESVLSLSVKFFGEPHLVRTVKKGSFNPPPRVDSAIIYVSDIKPRPGFDATGSDFFTLVKAGFQSKRKKVISNISAKYDKVKTVAAFKKLAIDENTRAEDLKLTDWIALLEQLMLE